MKDSSGATLASGEGYYLDPGHPDATEWNYRVAMDVASHYDIDGFHWDYIRYPGQAWGYNDTAIARYNAEYGLSGSPSSTNAQFSTWRRRQVTDFLRWTTADLLALKPQLKISTSVFASRSDAYTNRFQDWAAWNNEGILDLCMPMNYTTDNSTYFFPRADDAYVNQGVRWVLQGPGAYLNTKENTVVQLNYCRTKGFHGTSLYSYRTPNSGTVNQPVTFQYIEDNYQPTYESVPALPWKASPTKGIIKGTVTRADNGQAIYNATLTLVARTQLTEPHGKYAFFESDPGSVTVQASAPGFATATGTATITAGLVTTLDFAMGLAAPDETETTPTQKINWTANAESKTYSWFGNDSYTRGMALNPATGHLLVARCTGSSVGEIHILNTDLDELGTMNVTGISGGTRVLNKVCASSDGVVYACNLVVAAQTPLTIYRWANEGAAPTAVTIDWSGVSGGTEPTLRRGDDMELIGAGASTRLLVSGSASTNRVYILNASNAQGTAFTAVEIAPGTGFAAVTGQNIKWEPDGSAFWWRQQSSTALYKFSATDGTQLGSWTAPSNGNQPAFAIHPVTGAPGSYHFISAAGNLTGDPVAPSRIITSAGDVGEPVKNLIHSAAGPRTTACTANADTVTGTGEVIMDSTNGVVYILHPYNSITKYEAIGCPVSLSRFAVE